MFSIRLFEANRKIACVPALLFDMTIDKRILSRQIVQLIDHLLHNANLERRYLRQYRFSYKSILRHCHDCASNKDQRRQFPIQHWKRGLL